MKNAWLRRVVVCVVAGGLWLVAITLIGPIRLDAGRHAGVEMRRMPLEEPAVAVSDGSVRNGRLFFSDHHQGIREIDLETGRSIRRIEIGSASGFSSIYLGIGNDNSVVFGSGLRWYRLDRGWKVKSSDSNPYFAALGSPIVFSDRAIVYGTFTPEITTTSHAWLATLYHDGTVLPLAEFDHGLDNSEVVRRVKFMAVMAGGVAVSPGGGFVALDPRSYRVLLFDARDRLVGSWKGRNPRFHPPNLEALPLDRGPDQRDGFFRWHLGQVLVKRPVFLTDDLLAVVIGLPDGPLHQRYEIDLYRPGGDPVAIGLKVRPIPEQRVVVADTDDGSLVLVAQEKLWPPGSPTAVYIVEVQLPVDAPIP